MRHPNRNAIEYWNAILGFSESQYNQDWEFECADPERVQEFTNAFRAHSRNDDDQFTLMKLIVASLEEHFLKYGRNGRLLNAVIDLIVQGQGLHLDTVDYWTRFEEDNPDHFWCITQDMRELYKELMNRIQCDSKNLT
jgi:hypothetical protein